MSGNPKIKFPITLEDLFKLDKDKRNFSAKWEDYLDLLVLAEYKAEFHENTIYTISNASDNHEEIVANLIFAFGKFFFDDPKFHIRASSRNILVENKSKAYLPDVQIVKGKSIHKKMGTGQTAISNPWLVVEVLSPSTNSHDWNNKLPNYKKIPSLKYILYIEQSKPYISIYSRKGKTSIWENQDFDSLKESIKIADKKIDLKTIYNKIIFYY